MARAIWALGTMSGTSMDGVDAAMLLTDGETIEDFGASAYEPYTDEERTALRAAQGRWPDEAGVAAAEAVVEAAHLRLLRHFEGAEVIAFHGQTLAHEPGGRGTHQAGNGKRLAEALGLPVVWDFRSADVGLGGQGAPLAPFYHFALARHIGAAAPTGFLNLGGVGNLTVADPAADRPEAPGALIAFDTGPANAPMDDLVLARLGQSRDTGGALALSGSVDENVVARALSHRYFAKIPPKSLDRGDFAFLGEAVAALETGDALATLAAISAGAVALGFEQIQRPPGRVFVSGGGRHNRALMAALTARLGIKVAAVEDAGFDGDMIEAQAFAYLGVRVMRKLPTSAPGTTGVPVAVGGGVVSRPGGGQAKTGD